METMKTVVKISISGEKRTHVDSVIYYRSGMSADFAQRWMWYFEYLAALVKVANPRKRVELYRGPQTILLGAEWHEHRRQALIKSRTTKLKQLMRTNVDDDLFHFTSDDHAVKIEKIQKQLSRLDRDEEPIPEFPEYINQIKKYIL